MDFLSFPALRATAATKRPLVALGKGADSKIVARAVKGLAAEKGGLPPEDATPRPTKAQVDQLSAWIDAGCPDPTPLTKDAPRRAVIGTVETYRAIKTYLDEKTDPENHQHLRFFTLTHLHNNPKVTDAQLQLHRAALAEAVNALSWLPRITQPVPIDPDRTVFAVDMRDVGWHPVQGWEFMAAHYPYGLTFQNIGSVLPQFQSAIQAATKTKIPVVRADWFAATATRPPVYHALLKLPTNLYDLETRLGVDAAENFRRNRVARAGVTKSGVSLAHRLVERHDALYGAYWKSYDFKQENRLSDLRRFPLGPLEFPRTTYANPFAEFTGFKQDGGEVIFNLPNGLQGYLLVDGKEERIDKGPPDVVADGTRVLGGTEVVNGISCMACHAHGMKDFTDVVREETVVRNKEYRKVELLYPLPLRMKGLVDEDQDRFMRSMEKAVGGYLPAGGLRHQDYADSAAAVTRVYLLPLTAETAAIELGISETNGDSPGKVLVRRLGEQGLRDLNVGALAAPNGSLRRENWEGGGVISSYQRVAAAARIGNPLYLSR